MSGFRAGIPSRQQLAKPQPERITRQQQAEKQSAWLKALHDYYANPFWAEDLPLPPDIDFKAIAEQDMKLFVTHGGCCTSIATPRKMSYRKGRG